MFSTWFHHVVFGTLLANLVILLGIGRWVYNNILKRRKALVQILRQHDLMWKEYTKIHGYQEVYSFKKFNEDESDNAG